MMKGLLLYTVVVTFVISTTSDSMYVVIGYGIEDMLQFQAEFVKRLQVERNVMIVLPLVNR